ncbi:MAG: AAA family ATPase [Rhodobacteraceae bacterium]|nr:AAA family ATPase [Paracoccaceae bacterium]
MGYQRRLNMDLPQGQSAFLWGARQTGKSTFLRQRFPNSFYIDLLNSDNLLSLSARPARLGEILTQKAPEILKRPIIIDEIQKVPSLLDEVHRLIESCGFSFILCGSSARRMRRAGVNLLGGRAWRFDLFPLNWNEVPEFDLLRALNRGMLPSIYDQPRFGRSLKAYVQDYLTEEIFNDATTRNAPTFVRFFDCLRFCHGELLNYTSISRECAIDAKTVKVYFDILQDSLVGYRIFPFHRSSGRQSITAAPKFFLFDVGVASHICGRSLTNEYGPEFGRAFEHFILLELIAARGYREQDYSIEFWRTKSGLEVDFILGGGEVAIEVKTRVRHGDLRAIRAFADEFSPSAAFVVTAEQDRRRIDDIDILPYTDFLRLLHDGNVI